MRDAGLSIIGVGGLRLDGVGQGSAASVMAELSAVGEAVVVTGSPREAGSPAVCQAALDALVPEAGKRGLGLYVTNEAGTCFEQLDALRALFTPARSGTLRFLLDVGAFYQAAVNPRDAWAEFAGQTGCVVVSDLQAGRRVPLGAGSVNVAGLLGDVVNEGYAGWSAADPPGANAASWLEGLRHDVRFIRERVDVL
jgi:sugar phosphate isomerase/epimerase